jgi:tyrosine-protein phosphatase SIW14
MSLTKPSALVGLLLFFGITASGSPAAHGVPNFRQVDSRVFRGGQPDQSGFAYLASIGVKTIIDLRAPGQRSSWEDQTVTALGMKYVSVPMTGLEPPTAAQISSILALLEGGAAGAVFVHCKRGADRTGAVIAAYRIDHDHWENGRALKEARSDGMRFFQWPRQNFIRDFQPLATQAKNRIPAQASNAPPALSANATIK